jgi:hypothetical protein
MLVDAIQIHNANVIILNILDVTCNPSEHIILLQTSTYKYIQIHTNTYNSTTYKTYNGPYFKLLDSKHTLFIILTIIPQGSLNADGPSKR